ncbi:hypothetical protein F2Q70_00029720 [Brassica cretica]|uniref:Uncharacterized protein n=1 Tax=Brassica cretica TaxID=69181 RepID=A0A8S9FJ42_BRACR|nr:hypothetical protein F2Q70_00029720 [Brassica cretica]
MLGQENVASPVTDRSEYNDRNTDEPSSVITQLPHMQAVRSLRSDRARAKARSLRSDRAFVSLGRYVVTELEPKLGLYVATERPFRSVAT